MATELLLGLAENPALPSSLVDRLIARAEDDLACTLAYRPDLTSAQVDALAARSASAAMTLVRNGRRDRSHVDLARDPDVAVALLDEGRGDPDWARLLAADPDPKLRAGLAACPDLPPEVVERLAGDPDPEVIAQLALYTTDREVLARLATHPHADVRAGVAGNEAAAPETLARLVTGTVITGWGGWRRPAEPPTGSPAESPAEPPTGSPAESPAEPPAGSPSASSAGLAAGDTTAPPAVCSVCAREPIPFVHDPHCPRLDCELPPGAACDGSHQSVVHTLLDRAVENPATPVTALTGLADHPSPIIRWSLAARPDLPPDVAEMLAVDPIPGVRADLAGNPALPHDLMRRMAGDPTPDVQRRLALNPRVPLDLLTDLAGMTRIGPNQPPRIAAAGLDELRALAGNPEPKVRMLVAERRDLPADVRDRLAADPDAKVLKSIAGHPGLSEEQLRDMVDRHGARVIAKVAINPDASAELLLTLVSHVPPVQKAFRKVVEHPHATAPVLVRCLDDHEARPRAAGHPALPPDLVVQLLSDDEPRVAAAAAGNPSLPAAEMERLVSALEG